MQLSTVNAILLIASCASAYENSSPFYLYSTSNFEISPIRDLSLASSVQSTISKSLSQCPTKNYIIVSQPGISADDFTNAQVSVLGGNKHSHSTEAQTAITVRDVIGTIDTFAIENTLKSACNIQSVHNLDASTDMIPELDHSSQSTVIVHIKFPALEEPLTSKGVRAVLHHHDFYLSTVVDNYFDGKDYTVIYTSSSREAAKLEQSTYKPCGTRGDDEELPLHQMHQDLKRGFGANLAKTNESSSSNQTIVDGPLFDKYQFLSPGIFMGGLVFLLLVLILYVGLSALSSLQVTYGAFDKEQGQLAGKKAQ